MDPPPLVLAEPLELADSRLREHIEDRGRAPQPSQVYGVGMHCCSRHIRSNRAQSRIGAHQVSNQPS
jgi:hypothetical protein